MISYYEFIMVKESRKVKHACTVPDSELVFLGPYLILYWVRELEKLLIYSCLAAM